MGAYNNRRSGFALVGEKGAGDNRTTVSKESVLINGQRHMGEVRVRNDSVSAYLDGELVRYMPTDYADLSCPADWDVGGDRLGVVTESPLVLHAAVIVPCVTSEGGMKKPLKNFVAKNERAADQARKNLLNAMDKKATAIRKSGLHPDLKQIACRESPVIAKRSDNPKSCPAATSCWAKRSHFSTSTRSKFSAMSNQRD